MALSQGCGKIFLGMEKNFIEWNHLTCSMDAYFYEPWKQSYQNFWNIPCL